MKSALFVDFDNVYSGLRRLDQDIADRFAQQPMRWIEWLCDTLPPPPHSESATRRRLLVRRCYLNPQAYQRFRPAFNRAGFEIVDCPPMTSEGKTSTDIHMVLDIVDLLQHQVHYDEFIVFSADADFTPVLRKLRRWDRRTTVLAIGFPSAAYQASADLLIDQDDFVRGGLGIVEDEDEDNAPTGDKVPFELLAQLSPNAGASLQGSASEPATAVVDSRRLSDLVRAEVRRVGRPVPCSRLAQMAIAEYGALADGWDGKVTFRRFLEQLDLGSLVIDWNAAGGHIGEPGMTMPRSSAPSATQTAAAPVDPLLQQVHTATGLPLMTAEEVRFLLKALADDVATHPFNVTQTGKRVRDRCRESGHAVSRSDVSYVLVGILHRGYDFGSGADDAASLGAKFIANVLRLCEREQLQLDDRQVQELRLWASPGS